MNRMLVMFPKEWAKDSNAARILTMNKMSRNGFMFDKEKNLFGGMAAGFMIGGENSGWLTWASMHETIRHDIEAGIVDELRQYAVPLDKKAYVRSNFDNTYIHRKDSNDILYEFYAPEGAGRLEEDYRDSDDDDDDDDTDEGVSKNIYVPKDKLKAGYEKRWKRYAPKELLGTLYPDPRWRSEWYTIPSLGEKDDAQIITRPIWQFIVRNHRNYWKGSGFVSLNCEPVTEAFINNYWVVLVDYEQHHND